MPEVPEGSVTHWIRLLQSGDLDGAQPLWECYFERLVRLCRRRLAGVSPGAGDGEDVALSVLESFFRGAVRQRFPRLGDRDDLWKLLLVIAARKAVNLRRDENRQKRGGGQVVGEHALAGENSDDGWRLEMVIGNEPAPDFAASVAETLTRLGNVLGDEMLRQVAKWKLEGFTNQEIAAQLRCAIPTVERKLRLIRNLWCTHWQELDQPGTS